MIRRGLGDSQDPGCFKCVKITLLVIHILGLLAVTILLVFGVLLLMNAGSQSDPEKERQMRNMGTVSVALFSFGIVYQMIAIMGVAKENKTIVIVYLVLSMIGIIGNLFFGLERGIMSLFVTVLTAYYAFLLVKKDRQSA